MFASSININGTPLDIGHILALVIVGLLTWHGSRLALFCLRFMYNVRSAATLLLAGFLGVTGVGGSVLYHDVQFRGQVESYVLASFKTENLEKAKKYLDNVIQYLKDRNAHEGFTSFISPSQEDDLSEFYELVVAARDDLDKPQKTEVVSLNSGGHVALGTDVMEKLRKRMVETGLVTVKDINGKMTPTVAKMPWGISLAPLNKEHLYLAVGGLCCVFLGGIWTSILLVRNSKQEKQEKCHFCKAHREKAAASAVKA